MQRLLAPQPKAATKHSYTGSFSRFALKPTVFDSHPASDAEPVLRDLSGKTPEQIKHLGVSALQIGGYAPRIDHMKALQQEGFSAGSREKATMAYDAALNDDSVLLAQFVDDARLNFDASFHNSLLQFRISRADLKLLAFERS